MTENALKPQSQKDAVQKEAGAKAGAVPNATAPKAPIELDAGYQKLLDRAEAVLPVKSGEDTRFKLSAPEIHIAGNKTLFKNFKETADKCRRTPEHLLKYLCRELATSAVLEGSQAVFTGRFNYDIVKTKLVAYFTEFVKCSQCDKPDTTLRKEGRNLIMKCEACGAKRPVRSL